MLYFYDSAKTHDKECEIKIRELCSTFILAEIPISKINYENLSLGGKNSNPGNSLKMMNLQHEYLSNTVRDQSQLPRNEEKTTQQSIHPNKQQKIHQVK